MYDLWGIHPLVGSLRVREDDRMIKKDEIIDESYYGKVIPMSVVRREIRALKVDMGFNLFALERINERFGVVLEECKDEYRV